MRLCYIDIDNTVSFVALNLLSVEINKNVKNILFQRVYLFLVLNLIINQVFDKNNLIFILILKFKSEFCKCKYTARV